MVNKEASMSEEALATKLYQTFDAKATGGGITSSLLTWSEGNPVSEFDFAEAIELLGTTECGVIELVVIFEQQFAQCPNHIPLIPWCAPRSLHLEREKLALCIYVVSHMIQDD